MRTTQVAQTLQQKMAPQVRDQLLHRLSAVETMKRRCRLNFVDEGCKSTRIMQLKPVKKIVNIRANKITARKTSLHTSWSKRVRTSRERRDFSIYLDNFVVRFCSVNLPQIYIPTHILSHSLKSFCQLVCHILRGPNLPWCRRGKRGACAFV